MNSLFFPLFLTESENEEELDYNTHVALIIIAKQKMKNGMEIIEIEKNYFLGHTSRGWEALTWNIGKCFV